MDIGHFWDFVALVCTKFDVYCQTVCTKKLTVVCVQHNEFEAWTASPGYQVSMWQHSWPQYIGVNKKVAVCLCGRWTIGSLTGKWRFTSLVSIPFSFHSITVLLSFHFVLLPMRSNS